MNKPKIIFDPEVLRKIQYFVDKADFEVSGLGRVIVENGNVRVISAFLLEQVGSGSATEIPAEAVGKALFDGRNDPGELKFWFHSHVNMPVFWSGTDTKNIEEFGNAGWCVASVFNKKGEMRSAICGGLPVPFFIDECPNEIAESPRDCSDWDAEFSANVKEAAFQRIETPSYNVFQKFQHWPKDAPKSDKELRHELAREKRLDEAWEKLERMEVLTESDQRLLTSEHEEEWRQWYAY